MGCFFVCYQAFFGLQLYMPCVFMDVWCVCMRACFMSSFSLASFKGMSRVFGVCNDCLGMALHMPTAMVTRELPFHPTSLGVWMHWLYLLAYFLSPSGSGG
jgi:hypothetical protein